MSTQADVNTNPNQYILYYCGADQKDATVYQQDCSNVCAFSYNETTGDLQINTWYVVAYTQPSNETLLSFALVDVLAWFDNFYTRPAAISNSQFNKYTTSELAATRKDDSLIQNIVFDTETHTTQYWNGSAWTHCFL
jgi:hypothetical protein